MSYRLTFKCDHDDCDRRVNLLRPEPSAMFSSHIPHGWIMQRAHLDDIYYVYCPQHKEEH